MSFLELNFKLFFLNYFYFITFISRYKFFFIFRYKFFFIFKIKKTITFFSTNLLLFYFFNNSKVSNLLFIIFLKISVSSIYKKQFIKNMYLSILNFLYKPTIFFIKNYIQFNDLSILNYFKKIVKPQSVWLMYTSPYSLLKIRTNLQFILYKHFIYQKKLTKFITFFYKFKFFELIYWTEFTLIKILSKSFFFISYTFLLFCINNNHFFLNTELITYKDLIVSPTDFIQFKFTLFIYLYLHNINFSLLFFKNIFFKILIQFNTKSFRIYPKTKSFYISNKLFSLINFIFLIPFYLEVDLKSFSVIVLQCLFYFMFYILSSLSIFYLLTNFKLFNWKYIL